MSTDTSRRWTPTRTSTAIASAVALVTAGALLWQVPLVVVPALVGSAGAVCFAGSLWLVDRDRHETLSTLLASLLTVPVAVGILVGTLGTVLLLLGAFFPVDSPSLLSLRSLLLVARVGLVAGCVFAVLGVALGVRNVADGDSLARYYWLTVKTGLVPAAVGTVLVVDAVRSAGRPPGRPDVLGTTLAALGEFLLSPAPFRTHLATVLFLVALAAVGVRSAVAALPVAEVLADRGAGDVRERRVARARSTLARVATVSALSGLLALVVELSLEPFELRQLVGVDLYGLLVGLTAAGSLRLLLVVLVALSVPTVLVAGLLRRAARASLPGFFRRVGPLVGGLVVTVAAVAVARPVLDGLVSWVAGQLPPVLERAFLDVTVPAVRFYGTPAIVVVLAAVLVGVTAVVVLSFRLALFAGYLTEETAGFSLAAGGLFAAAAFAGTVGADELLVFGGLVASLLVWDMGGYGTTLGREVGNRAPTRNAELVHAGGTLAVGVLGVLVAVGLGSLVDADAASASPPAIAALVGVLAGIVLLVAALR